MPEPLFSEIDCLTASVPDLEAGLAFAAISRTLR